MLPGQLNDALRGFFNRHIRGLLDAHIWSNAGTAVVSMNAFSAFRLAGGWWCRTNNALLLTAYVAMIWLFSASTC
jgi:hypothetical protein